METINNTNNTIIEVKTYPIERFFIMLHKNAIPFDEISERFNIGTNSIIYWFKGIKGISRKHKIEISEYYNFEYSEWFQVKNSKLSLNEFIMAYMIRKRLTYSKMAKTFKTKCYVIKQAIELNYMEEEDVYKINEIISILKENFENG